MPLTDPEPWVLIAAAAIMALGGFVKGAVGFALPMVALSGLGLFLTAQDAVALLLIPSAVSNVWQTLRQGLQAALETFRRFWRINLFMAVALAITAQLVPRIASDTLYAILGVTVSLVAILQLAGWRPRARADSPRRGPIEGGIGLFAGLIGGVTAVWGPAILYYLIALGTEKQAQVRMLGLNFLIGWWVLVGAHMQSGILNPVTLPISAAMLVPAALGMAAGLWIQDRLDQTVFLRATLLVLCLAGLNLLRRGLF